MRRERAVKFWASDYARSKFPKLSIIARSVYGIPSGDVENERDFSALSFVYSKLRRSMSDDNVARKLFLLLNPDWWTPNPGLKNDPMWMGIMEKAGLVEKDEEEDSDNDAPESDAE